MNTEFFIASRIIGKKQLQNKVSKPIVNISVLGIALGIALMISALSVVVGFQNEIRDKVIGFGAHIQITSATDLPESGSSAILTEQPFYPNLSEVDGIRHIQIYAIKPALLQNNSDEAEKNAQRDIIGVLTKGVDKSFDWSFFEENLVAGKIPSFNDSISSNAVVLSKYICQKLHLKIGDDVSCFFIRENGPSERKMKIAAIYETGLEELDKKIVLVDLAHLRTVNKWGCETSLTILDTCYQNGFIVEANGFGNAPNFFYDWGDGQFRRTKAQVFCPTKDTTIRVIGAGFSDYSFSETPHMITEADTAFLTIKIQSKKEVKAGFCYCSLQQGEELNMDYQENGHVLLEIDDHKLDIFSSNTGGSGKFYTGGFEVLIEKWEDLDHLNELIDQEELDFQMRATTIKEMHPEIFNWLNTLDINIYIIISLMIFVAIVNMTSALLVLILERTNMIGIFKAFGSSDWSIRKIFLYYGAMLIGRGILIGNIVGIGLLYLQKCTGLFKLDQSTYFLSEVPVHIDFSTIILLNIATIVICIVVLIIPSFLVSRIDPVKAIRFN